MKKLAMLFLLIALLLPCAASAYINPSTGMSTTAPVPVTGTLNQRMATRTGPGTQYTEPGTFFSKGDSFRIISISYDINQVPWVQVEINVSGRLMRVYTGLKRFDGVSASRLYREQYLGYPATLSGNYTPFYGPGLQYALHDFTLRGGSEVIVVDRENGYAMCEFYLSGKDKLYRAWFPDSVLY